MKSITIFLVLSIVHLRVSKGIDPPFTLIDSRLLDSRNLITLRCRRSSDDNFELKALYFRNGSNVDTIDGFLNLSDEAGVVKFEMTRALEGEYSCGNLNQRSNTIPLIGKLYVLYSENGEFSLPIIFCCNMYITVDASHLKSQIHDTLMHIYL